MLYCDVTTKVIRETKDSVGFVVRRHYLVLNFAGRILEVVVTQKEYDSAVIGTIYKLVEDRK